MTQPRIIPELPVDTSSDITTQINRLDVSGVGTLLSEDRHSLDIRYFPDNLGDRDLQHYVLFQINVRGKSKVQYGYDTLEGEIIRNNRAQLNPDESGRAFDLSVGLIAGGALAAFGAKKIYSTISSVGGRSGSAGARAAGSVIGGAAALGTVLATAEAGRAVSNQIRTGSSITQPDKMYRLRKALALHLEEKPTVRYSAEYSNKDLGALAGFLGKFSSATGAISGIANSSEVMPAVAMAVAKIPQIAGINTVDLLRSSAKVTTNPFREVLFESVAFRTFNFKYRFLPKSDKETEDVYSIINTFKEHMLPSVSPERLFFIYPSEFQIGYYFQDRENVFFHRFAPCALVDMQVEYGSGEGFSSFTDGAPTEINMVLSFKELEVITREKSKAGF